MKCNKCETQLSLTDNEIYKIIKTQFGGVLTIKTCENCGEKYYVTFSSGITFLIRTLAIALFGLSFLGFSKLFSIEISLVIGVLIIGVSFGIIQYAIRCNKMKFEPARYEK